MTEDIRLKKCPLCKKFWAHINEPMCDVCKSKGYHVETRRLEAKLGIPCEEHIEIVHKVRKHAK